MIGPRVVTRAGAAVLGGLSLLHLSWAWGSTWPARDRERLAQLAAGVDTLPSSARCVEVAAALAAAAGLVGGVGREHAVARVGRAGVAVTLLGRGLAGLTGNTHRLVGWRTSAEFDRWDRRVYGPLCCALGLAAAASMAPTRRAEVARGGPQASRAGTSAR